MTSFHLRCASNTPNTSPTLKAVMPHHQRACGTRCQRSTYLPCADRPRSNVGVSPQTSLTGAVYFFERSVSYSYPRGRRLGGLRLVNRVHASPDQSAPLNRCPGLHAFSFLTICITLMSVIRLFRLCPYSNIKPSDRTCAPRGYCKSDSQVRQAN